MTGLFSFVSVALLYAYIRTLSPTIPLEDGGEMIRAAATLGVTHPPGYPLYTLLGRMVCLVPVGDPAFRLNLLSAVCSAWACGICACIAAGILLDSGKGGPRRQGRTFAWIGGAFAGILLGTGAGVWWQSVIAEKYTANLVLNAVLAAAITDLIRGRGGVPRKTLLAAFVFGVSASHHGQTIYFAPAALFATAWAASKHMKRQAVPRIVLMAVFGVVLGMSLKFLYPPVRSVQGPLHCWNDPHELGAFVKYFSGNVYQYRVGSFEPVEFAGRLLRYFTRHVPNQFGLAGPGAEGAGLAQKAVRWLPVFAVAFFCLWGLAWQYKNRFAEFAAWGMILATGLAFCANFSLTGIAIQTYYIPTFMVLCLWAGLGAGRAAVLLSKRHPRMLWPAAAVLLVILAPIFRAGKAEADRSRHYFAYDFAKALLVAPESKSVLIPVLDYDMFPLWYVHDVLGKRPDVILADSNYKDSKWRDALAKRVARFYPSGYSGFTDRLKSGESPIARDLGWPVYFTLVYESMEEADLLPKWAVYKYVWREESLLKAQVMSEWRRFRKRRTVRGCFDRDVPKDRHTRFVVGYWAYSEYRRAHVLSRQGRYAEAEEILRAVLSWPAFTGEKAAVYVLYGWCLDRMGRKTEAVVQYEAAVRAAPEWVRAHKLLGTLYYDLGRLDDALRTLKAASTADPEDEELLRNVSALEALLSGRGGRSR